ncbi:hypothetical protein D3C73_991160 [compost metagenome]
MRRQIDKVGKGVRFQHLTQLKQLFGITLVKLLHAPLPALAAFDQIVTAEVQQKFPHHHRAYIDRARQLQLAEAVPGAQLFLINHLVERFFEPFSLFVQGRALAVETVFRLWLA